MNTIIRTRRIRRVLGLGSAATLLAAISTLGTTLIPLGSPAGATPRPSVQGTACVSQDASNGYVCQDKITGTGFGSRALLNVFVFRQSPALTGPGAGGGRNELTTQVTTSGMIGPPRSGELPGEFSVTFDNPDSGYQCPVTTKFTIEVQAVDNPSTWATATYTDSQGPC